MFYGSVKVLSMVPSNKLTGSLTDVPHSAQEDAGPCWAKLETFSSVCISRGHCHSDVKEYSLLVQKLVHPKSSWLLIFGSLYYPLVCSKHPKCSVCSTAYSSGSEFWAGLSEVASDWVTRTVETRMVVGPMLGRGPQFLLGPPLLAE